MAKRTPCIFLMVLLVHQAIGIQSAYSMQNPDKKAERIAAIKAKVEELGVGAEVKVSLQDGGERRGRIEEITGEDFRLARKEPMTVKYSGVNSLELVHATYKTKGQVDTIEVHRVAVNVGLGKKVRVRLASNKQLVGKLQSIETDTLVVVDSKTGSPTSVPFKEVTQIGRKPLSTGAKVAIWVGVVVALLCVAASGAIVGPPLSV